MANNTYFCFHLFSLWRYRQPMAHIAIYRQTSLQGEREVEPNSLSENEAAKLLHVSARTLQRWREQRTGPTFIKLANRIRYPRAELIEFLAQHIVLAA